MQNKRQVFTWPISLLIVVVSFLSVLVVLQQVQAAWVEPNYLPEATNPNSFVFNPLAENLDLGLQQITKTTQPTFVINPGGTTGLRVGGTTLAGNFDGNVNITGDLTVSGDINGSGGGGGGGASSADWAILNGALYYTTTTGNGKVGIGTSAPNRLLHIYKDSGDNAELDIQSTSAAGSHWGIYHDATSNDLRFWKGGLDIVTFADTGELSINTTPSASNQLTVNGASKNGIRSSVNSNNTAAVYGYSSFYGAYPNNSYAIRAEANDTFFTGGTGLYATGNYGVKAVGSLYGLWASATSQSGEAIYAEGVSNGNAPLHIKANGAANGAALFEGNVTVSGGTLGVSGNITSSGLIRTLGPNSYIFINSGNGAPTLLCTDTTNRGATYLDYTNFRLYVCTGTTGWKSTLLN
ncbi:MAG: hypothetical protein QG642_199 [Patescibacteria group bacterium]|nr:hypothetical protein [Patescibacteria group bacterium]